MNKKTAKKIPSRTWTHEFVCLHDKDADIQPSQELLLTLVRNGLGVKRVTFAATDDGAAVTEAFLRYKENVKEMK